MWSPLVALLQDHEDSVYRQRLEELLCVHPCAVFIQHQGADTQYAQRVTDLRGQIQRGTSVHHMVNKCVKGHVGALLIRNNSYMIHYTKIELYYSQIQSVHLSLVNFYRHEPHK